MALDALAFRHGVLSSNLQLVGASKEGKSFSSFLEFQRVFPRQIRQSIKRLQCGSSRRRSNSQYVVLRLHLVNQPQLVTSASQSALGGCKKQLGAGKRALHSSSSDLFSRTRKGYKLSSSKTDSSNTRTSDEDDNEKSWESETHNSEHCDDYSQSMLEPGENATVEGAECTNDDEPIKSQVYIAEKDVKVSGSGGGEGSFVKGLIGSYVRTLSGASSRERKIAKKENNGDILRRPLRLLSGTDPSPAGPWRKKFADGWRRAESDFFAFSRQLGKYVFIMSGTGAVLATGFELGGSPHDQGLLWFSWLSGVVIGSMIGAGQVLENHAKAGRRTVVITGSTRGLGKALAREFLRHGDNVVITSRSLDSVNSTVDELRTELEEQSGTLSTAEAQMELFGLPRLERPDPKVVGVACDVSKSQEVKALATFAVKEFGTVDIWINNAGVNYGFKPLLDFSDKELEQIVSTNLTGSMICTREAIKLMKSQLKGGHVFNMDGAGSGGSSTPLTAAYGATKCGLKQLHSSVLKENKGSRVGIHTASPGMVLTDLLLSGASLQNKRAFNFICEQPETVARALVPNLRLVKGTGKAINYLTPTRIVLAILQAWIRRGRWFDEEGRAVYAAEAERLRLWAEGRERSPATAAMELVPSGTWVSLFSSSVICAYIILTSTSNNMPGT